MDSHELDFELPPRLIAQTPSPQRQASRLLQYRMADRSIEHRHFADLPHLLRPGDLLVMNDTKVSPCRFLLRKSSGGAVDGLFLGEPSPGRWEVMLRNLGPATGHSLHFDARPDIAVDVVESKGEGQFIIQVHHDAPALVLLEALGRMPLPPYIKRRRDYDPLDELDRRRYQTVYAAHPGAVAAPTAGLHFTPELMKELDQAGVQHTFVTLHVGIGTFKPVTADRLESHVMHEEQYVITPEAADAINRAQADSRRIIAVGTTTVRVLESRPADRPIEPTHGRTDIFIRPGYAWKRVHSLITNFHLPRSTLIALVASLVGLEEQRRIYREAIRQEYRFFSYGDAMWVE